MTPDAYLRAARCPATLEAQKFGLWEIWRAPMVPSLSRCSSLRIWTAALFRYTEATIHLESPGEVVMEDSLGELRQHLPIWLRAHGRVLVTGLGLGCVVRGLLANPRVERIDVIEIDRDICDVIGPEFAGSGENSDDRVNLIEGDALTYPINVRDRWDCAWHDIWVDESAGAPNLQVFHAELITRFMPAVRGQQGAWKLPRFIARRAPTVAGLR